MGMVFKKTATTKQLMFIKHPIGTRHSPRVAWCVSVTHLALAALGLHCGAQVLHWGARASLHGPWAPEWSGSESAGEGLISQRLALQPGIEPTSPASKGRLLTVDPPGRSLNGDDTSTYLPELSWRLYERVNASVFVNSFFLIEV